MSNSKLLILMTLFSSNIVADSGEDVAVGRNHWAGNCMALCSESEEYFINKNRNTQINSMEGPYQVWKFDSRDERVNCDCDGFYNQTNKTPVNNSYDWLTGIDISLALENLLKPVHLFYEIDTDGDRMVSYSEALTYYSKNDSLFEDEHFSIYFNWISYGDSVQEFDEAIVYAAIQSAQLVLHYSLANGLMATVSLRNSIGIAKDIITLFDLGSDVFRDELFRSLELDILRVFVEKDVQENKNVLSQIFEGMIEGNLVILLQN